MSHQVLGGNEHVRLAIAQVSPVFMDKEASLERAETAIAEAAAEQADLIVFPEAWLAGYPYWTEGWDSGLADFAQTRTRWFDQAVRVGSDDTARLSEAARRHGIHVVMGCNEMDARSSVSTIYNSLLFFDRDGHLLGRHRKLMPTFGERQFWGYGKVDDLRIFETDIGRIGGLICGEHLMPLVRAAMIELGEDIHVAAFPGSFALHTGPRLEELDQQGDFWGVPSSRNHAFEAGAFVLRACAYVDPDDVDPQFPHAKSMNIDYARGGSAVISPLGVPLTEPDFSQTILYADAHAWMIKTVKAIVDTAGHYARPDSLRLATRTNGGWAILSDADHVPSGFGERLARSLEKYGLDVAEEPEIITSLEARELAAGQPGSLRDPAGP